MKKIAIFSAKNDLHALVIHEQLNAFSDCQCQIFETDNLAGNTSITWSLGDTRSCELVDHEGKSINIAELDLIWWRRSGKTQKVNHQEMEDSHVDLINNECAASILGGVLTHFKGKWVSEPTSTTLAENKLYQLAIAKDVGFHVPETMITQDPDKVRLFCDKLNGEVIIKPVRGTGKQPLFTRQIDPAHLKNIEGMKLAPATYQQSISGFKHLRINCFGSNIKSVMIEADRLDWRENLDVPIYEYQLSSADQQKVYDLLNRLNLRMGIIDCKIDDQGKMVWLEVNPQGQFLFIEGVTNIPIMEAFTRFLRQELELPDEMQHFQKAS